MTIRIAFLACLALAACANEVTRGAGLYADSCAACHGADGRGGGEAFDGTLPPDLTTLAKREGGFPTIYVMSTIDGYSRAATHGPMPVFGALLDSPIVNWAGPDGEVTPTPIALIQLAAYLESLQEG
ncbi:MAG: cytochrome c [Maritimibacter sp.]